MFFPTLFCNTYKNRTRKYQYYTTVLFVPYMANLGNLRNLIQCFCILMICIAFLWEM